MGLIGELRERHQERAAAALVRLYLLGERVEQRQDPIAGMRPAGQGCGVEPLPVEAAGTLHVRADEVVL